MKELLDDYFKEKIPDEYDRRMVHAYTYQMFMKKEATTEYALTVNFDPSFHAYLPLGTSKKLASPDFPIPLVFIYGDKDWVKDLDQGSGAKCVKANKEKHGNGSNHYILPNSGHNLHIDNT